MLSDAHLLFILLGAGASIISAVFGFGTAMILLAGGALILPVRECIALATILFAVNTVTKSWLHRNHIDWPLTIRMSLISLPFAYLGAELMVLAPADLLKKTLALTVILHVLYQMTRKLPPYRPAGTALAAVSGCYGFLSGLIGTGNIIKALFLDRAGFEKRSFVGVMAATSVLANLGKLVSYQQSGLIGSQHVAPAIGLLAASLVSAYAGSRLLDRITSAQFKKGLQIMMLIIAVSLLVT